MTTLALPNAVLEDLQWLQRLAALMARDADEADDLVQETLVEAWRAPPADTSRPLRPWLGTVLRNRLRMRKRSAIRREAREERAPALGAEARAPDREHERLEVLRILLAELQALPAEDQRIIVRRFFEGESAAEIGRALDISSATIRSRIHRSLGRLRSALDDRFGSRETWCAAVVAVPPTLGGTAPLASHAASSKTMSITMKTLLLAALGGTTGVVGWAVTRPDAEPDEALAARTITVDATPSAAAGGEAARELEADEATAARARPDEPQARWKQRVRSIRSQLPAPSPAGAAPAATRSETARDQAAHDELMAMVEACMEDLGAEASGAVTLSVHELGAPGVGTIYESIEVVDATFPRPEVLECLTQSMYAYVGEAPDEPHEHVYSWTLALGKARTDREEQTKMIGYIFGAHMGEVRFCESKAEGPVTGAVTVEMTIDESGAVELSQAQPSELPAAVVECIVAATKRWVFPAKLAGKRIERELVLPVPGQPPGPVREQ